MRHTGGAAVTRRALLGAATLGFAAGGCSSRPEKPAASPRPDPQLVLLTSLIQGKEDLVTLYQQAMDARKTGAAALEPFRQRHLAHLAALRRFLPPGAAPGTSGAPPSAAGPPSPSPAVKSGAESGAEPGAVSVGTLRAAERRAAAARPAQMAGASPALAQLLASIGACEAVHVIALGSTHA
ncbi:hypothetical protein JOL79_03335 [Microbispora sp. RL4-1S]|uniref:DUF4439 domain-containing protein n=1 Tax=Microbispora oryzae TaxID=2806554 RepID=A0A941AGB8_9ACTN|nr:hypothetical protein [Microbispora oryzae]MBP2702836.1 hypothetical protein [Microbispora oryzae]